jgi:hypothetical protein
MDFRPGLREMRAFSHFAHGEAEQASIARAVRLIAHLALAANSNRCRCSGACVIKSTNRAEPLGTARQHEPDVPVRRIRHRFISSALSSPPQTTKACSHPSA